MGVSESLVASRLSRNAAVLIGEGLMWVEQVEGGAAVKVEAGGEADGGGVCGGGAG